MLSDGNEKWTGMATNLEGANRNALESTGNVVVEILEKNVASEVTMSSHDLTVSALF